VATVQPVPALDRPLRVGELLVAAVQIYARRPLAFLALGSIQAGALLATVALPFALDLVVLACSFALAFAAVVRVVAGDPLTAALRRTAALAPTLLALAFVVAIPFYLGSGWLLLLVFSVFWLGLTAFAIPAAMLEEPPARAGGSRLAHALRRTVTLARAQYLHAVGVAAALVVVYIVVGVLLALALAAYADNGRVAALAIEQVVLAPFFFIGLTVLYFEQQARVLEAAGRAGAPG
jgi:hypothetical protein